MFERFQFELHAKKNTKIIELAINQSIDPRITTNEYYN